MEDLTKKCFKCGEVKPLSEFYKDRRMNDGHLGKCKDCTRLDAKENRWAHHDRYMEYERRRRGSKSRMRQRSACTQRWRRSNPEKRKAQRIVERAIAAGELKRQSCEECGEPRSHAHHDDYSDPLDVRWLCASHHTRHHAAERF